MKLLDFLKGLGVIGVLLTVMCLILLPLVMTVIVGVAIANLLGFTGILWWAFVILFYLVIGSIISTGTRKTS